MIRLVPEAPHHAAPREALLDLAMGPGRTLKTSERLREGRRPAPGLAYAALGGGRLVGTLRLWSVSAGPHHAALLLGPLAVDPAWQGEGIGSRLMEHGLGDARALGHRAVLLVGDGSYYQRFGFATGAAEGLFMPGPFERHRFLGLELRPGALAGATGVLAPTGEPVVEVAEALAA